MPYAADALLVAPTEGSAAEAAFVSFDTCCDEDELGIMLDFLLSEE